MFTGIIEDKGQIERVNSGQGGGSTLVIRTGLDPETINIGDSVCVNGVCLTAVEIDGACFSVAAGPETLSRTTTGRLKAGSAVNLERAMAVGSRFGGHIVSGHVDGIGTLRTVRKKDNAWLLQIEAPLELRELIAPQGSITIDGISLTVTDVSASTFGVMIIPHTWQVTTLSGLQVGSVVNLEIDLIARYVARLLDARGLSKKTGLTEAELRARGY